MGLDMVFIQTREGFLYLAAVLVFGLNETCVTLPFDLALLICLSWNCKVLELYSYEYLVATILILGCMQNISLHLIKNTIKL